MIRRSELAAIGYIPKTHGLRGELNVQLNEPFFPFEALQHVVLNIDGIYVPFRIASSRPRGDMGALLMLEDVNSADEASAYTGHELFALLREMPDTEDEDDNDENGLYAEDLEDFEIIAPDGQRIGIIDHVDTSTMNTLLYVRLPDNSEVLVPLAEDWILDMDPEHEQITMDIPEALLNNTI